MGELSIYQALTIYTWFPLAFTLAVLQLIARFYERFSGTRTYWQGYIVPVLAYAAALVREAALASPGDPFANAMQIVAGGVMLVLTLRLSMLMLRVKPKVASVSPLVVVIVGTLGPVALGVALAVMARLTHRMEKLNRSPPYHRAYYVAAVAMFAAALVRPFGGGGGDVWSLAYPALMAAATTIGGFASWRAWSWLLVERA